MRDANALRLMNSWHFDMPLSQEYATTDSMGRCDFITQPSRIHPVLFIHGGNQEVPPWSPYFETLEQYNKTIEFATWRGYLRHCDCLREDEDNRLLYGGENGKYY